MKTTTHPEMTLGTVLTLSQLAAQLGVSVQTLYDRRSRAGRGPRGFRHEQHSRVVVADGA